MSIPTIPNLPQNNSQVRCGYCNEFFKAKTKPSYCSDCNLKLHRNHCKRKHICQKQNNLLSSPLDTRQAAHPQQLVTAHASNPLQERTDDLSPVSTANSALSSLVPPPLQRSNDNSPCRTLSVLNPDAQHFQPNVQNTRSKRNPDPSAVFTPSEAELNSLKIELSYARTQIINLEAELEDKKKTNDVYLQKIKLLEASRSDILNDKYFSRSPVDNLTGSLPSSSSCICQIKQVLSSISNDLKQKIIGY